LLSSPPVPAKSGHAQRQNGRPIAIVLKMQITVDRRDSCQAEIALFQLPNCAERAFTLTNDGVTFPAPAMLSLLGLGVARLDLMRSRKAI
jgi:hypothetical protein